MIKVLKSEQADWLVRFILPSENILSLNPIIAGGSMLSIYRAIKLHDTPSKWAEFKRCLERTPGRAKFDKFNDIDIWFDAKNPIHNVEHEYNWLIATFEKKSSETLSATLNKYIKVPLGTLASGPAYSSTYKFEGDLAAKKLMGVLSINKSTNWANSFSCRTKLAKEIQFIKKNPTSVADLLSSFDFINCSVAYYGGKLYYDDRIDNAFDLFELQLNNSEVYQKDSIALRVFNAIRAFKYSNRYNLDFSLELTEYIFKTLYDAKDIDYTAYKDKVVELETLYGKTLASVNTLKGMVDTLQSCFGSFSKMKFFKKEHAIYLIDNAEQLSGLKEMLDSKNSPAFNDKNINF